MPAIAISVMLEEDTRQQVNKIAEALHLTPEAVLRVAVGEYIDRRNKLSQFGQDTIKAWEEYQATGLHATHDEVDVWLRQLEPGGDAPPPECHR